MMDNLLKIFILFIKNMIDITPGPGTYRLPSEFGYYEAARKGGADPLESSGQMKGSVQNENTKSQGSLHNTSTQQASTQEKPKAQHQSSPAKNTSNQRIYKLNKKHIFFS